MDIIGILFIGIMVLIGLFYLILAGSDKFDRIRGKEPEYGSFGDGKTSWGDVVGILIVFIVPGVVFLYFIFA